MRQTRAIISFWLIVLPNLALFYVSLFLAIAWRYPNGLNLLERNTHVQAFSIIFALWALVFFSHKLFEPETFRRYTTLIFNLVSATAINLLIAVAYFYFQPELILTPRRFLLGVILASFVLILFWDLAIKYFLKNRFLRYVYLFSFNKELERLEQEVKDRDYLGYRVLGHLGEQALANFNPPNLCSIILPDNLNTKPEIVELFYKLRNKGVTFYNHKDFYEQLLRRVYLPGIDQLWLLEHLNYDRNRFYELTKEILDSIFGLIMFALFLVTWPIVRILTIFSNGPIFFTQERMGKNGQSFNIYKYRTMTVGEGNTWTQVQDTRITPIGKWLRKTRLDELPQFINLLKGNMSMVGPRPEQSHFLEFLKKEVPFFEERHRVKPGITGWAQLNVYAGSVEETKQKLEYDLYYIKHRSFFFDLEILIKTVYNIISLKGK